MEWYVLILGFIALIALFFVSAHATPARHWIAIRLEDITEIENQADKPCKPEVELKRTAAHPEGELLPNGWADCEKVRIRFRAITVIR